MMTIGWWIFVGVCALVTVVVAIGVGYSAWDCGDAWLGRSLIALLIGAVLTAAVFGSGYWYCNNTAGGVRAMKDQTSSLNNGLMREITITAEDGREIFYYKGKCDIETNANYILFEDENGLRQMVYWGELDTIIILELSDKGN